MIARLRRHRWLAALLFAASPAVAGQALPVLHPCPVDAPWTAGKHMAMAGMSHHETKSNGHSPAHHECSCLSQCSAAAITTPVQASVVAIASVAPKNVFWPVIEAQSIGTDQVDRLPEKTAPPLV